MFKVFELMKLAILEQRKSFLPRMHKWFRVIAQAKTRQIQSILMVSELSYLSNKFALCIDKSLYFLFWVFSTTLATTSYSNSISDNNTD